MRDIGRDIGVTGANSPPHPPISVVSVVSNKLQKSNNGRSTDELQAPIRLYNEIFGTKIELETPGNLKAAERALDFGYTLEHMRRAFEAVKGKKTDAARWCYDHNREFEYLVRPQHKHYRTHELVPGRIDVILNELATGRRGEE
jgi:hypothetical protein